MPVTWFGSNLCKFRIDSDLNLGDFLIQVSFRAEIKIKVKGKRFVNCLIWLSQTLEHLCLINFKSCGNYIIWHNFLRVGRIPNPQCWPYDSNLNTGHAFQSWSVWDKQKYELFITDSKLNLGQAMSDLISKRYAVKWFKYWFKSESSSLNVDKLYCRWLTVEDLEQHT